MSEKREDRVLCAASSYDEKFYFNPRFSKVPEDIKKQLNVICVLFTEDVGGIIQFVYAENGDLMIETSAADNDFLYDDIGAGMLVNEIRKKRKEMLFKLETYYKVMFLGMKPEELLKEAEQ